MSAEYTQLLDATIAHLETLKERGIAWVPVRRETLSSVAAPVPRSVPQLSHVKLPKFFVLREVFLRLLSLRLNVLSVHLL